MATDKPLLAYQTLEEVQSSRAAPNFVQDWQFPGWGEQRRIHFPRHQQHHRPSAQASPPAGGPSTPGGVAAGSSINGGAAATGSQPTGGGATPADQEPAGAGGEPETLDGEEHKHVQLGEWAATALSGNDITSSCLYVVGLCFSYAGWLAPVCLLIVAFLLFLFRYVYAEVGSALPVNGGSYTALLHTTSKAVACCAAVLSLLAYVTTAVVSATDAVVYLETVATPLEGFVRLPVLVLLAIFCLLTIYGVGESASVALAMFIVHLLTLLTLIVFSFVYIGEHGFGTLVDNMKEPLPETAYGTVLGALFFGFGSAMLGVSGFETAANFIEEQAPGVFPKVLRNMWVAVSVLNPVLAFCALAVMPMSDIYEHSSALLSEVAAVVGGPGLQIALGVDAFIVLSGAVLTGYVGVSGLMQRMSADRCLPDVLLIKNSWRGTMHLIPIVFLVLTSSLSLILGANVDTLSGVYTISFLGVMSLFGIGSLLLKRKRPSLPRPYRASMPTVLIALGLTIVGLISNIAAKPDAVSLFVGYSLVVGVIVYLSFQWAWVVRSCIPCCQSVSRRICGAKTHGRCNMCLIQSFLAAQRAPVVFFAKHADLHVLNKAILYVRDNEQTNRVVVVHVKEESPDRRNSQTDGDHWLHSKVLAGEQEADASAAAAEPRLVEVPAQAADEPRAAFGEQQPLDEVSILSRCISILDAMYPKLRIDLMVLEGGVSFGPRAVKFCEEALGIESNSMFIACPDAKFTHTLASLGGIRVITRPARPMQALPAAPSVQQLAPLKPQPSDASEDVSRQQSRIGPLSPGLAPHTSFAAASAAAAILGPAPISIHRPRHHPDRPVHLTRTASGTDLGAGPPTSDHAAASLRPDPAAGLLAPAAVNPNQLPSGLVDEVVSSDSDDEGAERPGAVLAAARARRQLELQRAFGSLPQ